MVNFTKKLRSLYYINRGYISIIKCAYFFHNSYRWQVSFYVILHCIKCKIWTAKLTKKVSPLYYTNVPPISIIKCRPNFSKITVKKVLLHTASIGKSTYVVISQVGDFNLQCFWHPMGSVIILRCRIFCTFHFQLHTSAAHCGLFRFTEWK